MSAISAVIVIGVGVMIIASNTPAAQARRREKMKERIEKISEPYRKKGEKCKYINSLIDEIPELSYYEAAQLKKKLGDIYSEWNEE